MNNTKENSFIAWEYVDIDVKRNNAPLYKDCYQNFGWFFIEQCDVHHTPSVPSQNISTNTPEHTTQHSQELVKLKFKRDSRLPNKIQVEQLQSRCNSALSSIQHLENKKDAYSLGTTIGFGGVGALFLGFAIFNFSHTNGTLGVVSTIISLAGWIAAYYFSAKVTPKKNAQINPQISEQFDIVYQTCEQANSLLA